MESFPIIETRKIEDYGDDSSVDLAVETMKQGKQVLIFNNSKRSSEATADKVAKKYVERANNEELEKLSEQILKVLPTPTTQCKRLANAVKKGVAFHHSGLVGKQRSLIENAFKQGILKAISSTPTLCLAKGTKVWSNNKKISIEKLKTNQVFALKDSSLNLIKPEKVENNGYSDELIEIESVSSHKIKATKNHKFLIRRKGKKLILQANEIKKTDLIATVGKIEIKEKNLMFSQFILDNSFPLEDKEIPAEIFYLIGAMLGDGYSGAEKKGNKIKYKGSPSIVGVDNETFDRVRFSCKLLRISYRKTKNIYGTPQLVLGKNNWFREFLVRCGVDVSVNKNISEELKLASKEKISNLLKGLFDTDGYAEKRGQLGYSSISLDLIKDVQELLYRFGITSRIRKRKKKSIRISNKEYDCKDSYELIIAENNSMLSFFNNVGFNINRKKEVLDEIIHKIQQNILYKECNFCNYKLYSDLFGGRTKSQKDWGNAKLLIIKNLEKFGPLTSKDLTNKVGFEIRKNSSRLNHHYELIGKTKFSKYDWTWNLNSIGKTISKELKNSSYEEIFERTNCLVCGNKLNENIRNNWKNSNKDGDIFWDQIKSIKKIKEEVEVFDVVLPSDDSNDHLFVAEGFITHNSAGLNLPAYKVIIRDYKRYSRFGFADIPVLEFHQMAGRAGRPGLEFVGKAVVCVKTEDELARVTKKYVFGQAEEVISKLAVEPTLKMYMLSLIAMDIINTKQEIKDFFKNTLYAHQYQDHEAFNFNLFRILNILKDYRFISQEDDYFMATPIGKKVSELYLNPDTANYFYSNLDKFIKKFSNSKIGKNDIYSLLYFVSDTLEMKPLFSIRKNDEERLQLRAEEVADGLIVGFDPYEMDYKQFLSLLKVSDLFLDWISEKSEDYLCDLYGVTPGEMQFKFEIVDWLLYALEEMALMKKSIFVKNYLTKLRQRFKFGVKEELLMLIKLKGVGRVRARKLYNAGFKTLNDIRKASSDDLVKVISSGLALSLKKQIEGSEIGENKLALPRELRAKEVSDEEIEVLLNNEKEFEKQKKGGGLLDYF